MAQKVRVVRTNIATPDQEVEGRQQIWGRYAAIKALIRRTLPASSASTLTEPVSAGANMIDWHSDLGGQPVALTSLQGEERQRVERLLADRLAALRDLAQRTPDDPVAQDLLQAAQVPDPNQVYVMNGQPVVVGWGLGPSNAALSSPSSTPTAAAAPLAAATAPIASAAAPTNAPTPTDGATGAAVGANVGAAAAATAAGTAGTAAAATQEQAPTERRRSLLWLWILLGILGFLILLGLLLWWLFGDWDKAVDDILPPPTVEEPLPQPTEETPPPAAIPPGQDGAEQPVTPQPSAEEQQLRDRIAAAEAELRRRLNACPVEQVPLPSTLPEPAAPQGSAVTPPVEPPVEPPAETPAPELPAPPVAEVPETAPPIPESKPTPPPRPQVAETPPASPQPAPPQSGSQPQPQKSASACPTPRKKWEAPELVVLLDRSGSMRLRAGIPQSKVEDLYRRASRGDAAALAELNSLVGQGDNSRLGVAKGAVRDMMETLPKDVDVGLVVFGQCSGAESFKFFSANDRPRLLGLLQSITPQDGTPLARGLERAGTMVDGVSVPATVVVVTDGEDSCGGDPCAVARALKAQKPNLTINVVDVNGSGEAACMAQATGGKVYRMRSPDDLDNLIQKASGETPVPPGCE
jgi:Mg-chelatase subunit ChlD